GCRPSRSGDSSVVVVMSDAEKMGLWPARRGTTYDLCYREGWMSRFLKGLRGTAWIETVLLSEVLEQKPPRRLVYLPSASYDRMAVWALPTEARRRLEALPGRLERAGVAPELQREVGRFTCGTYWRNFLVKYPAADRLHKAYLYTRDRLTAAEDSLSPGEENRLWERLDAATVNDVYWHGLFGGVYYHFLRHHCYRCLAEVLARLDTDAETEIGLYDYERLGRPGALITDSGGTVVLDHAGAVLDWFSKVPPAGLAGGFTRIAEPYHRGDERGFTVDRARRGFCRVAVMPGRAAKERLLAGRGVVVFPELKGPLVRKGLVCYGGRVGRGGMDVELGLEYSPVTGGWRCGVGVVNPGLNAVSLTLALDSTPSPPSGPRDLELALRFEGRDGTIPQRITRRGGHKSVRSWFLTDRRAGLTVTSLVEPAAGLWSSPIYTVEATEAGIKRSWQGLTLVWTWFLRLEPGAERKMEVRFVYSTDIQR
ncbi:DUF1925 domain-containing protein, partial [bacterium]|nr:DUF1925 domain-containing protein [bacterium]